MSSKTQRETGLKLGPIAFLLLQTLLIVAAVAWGAQRSRVLAAKDALPQLRDEPLEVTPLYDDPEVVSDEQLRRILPRLTLRFEGDRTVIGQVDHSLRMWGPDVTFSDPEMMSGKDMLWLLTNQNRFEGVYGDTQEPLLIDEGAGVRIRALEGPASASHVDHTLASLAELGMSLDLPIVFRHAGTGIPERTTLRAVLEQSLRDFSLNQPEYEWSALAYALFLPPTHRWVTSEGQEMTFDRLADRIMREELPNGVCSGNHRLFTLAIFLRVDDLMSQRGKPPILSLESRQRIERYLRDVTDMLIRHQHPDGFWNGDWPTTTPATREPTSQIGDRLSTRIIVTGHTLEWWALAPRELLPPRRVVIDAAQWIVRTIDGMTPEEIQDNNSYLSHAGRALALWRGELPSEVDLSGTGTRVARSPAGAGGEGSSGDVGGQPGR
jgi:hypothetical protein